MADAVRLKIQSVAVLGAGGTMGKGIARNLALAGIEVRAWNRTRRKLDDLAGDDRIRAMASRDEAVADVDVIISMLSDADAVLEAMGGDGGALASARVGSIWVQMGTIGIEGTERCAELARGAGVVLVDAPVLGTKQPAEEGELVILASGPEELRDGLDPIFDAIGKRTIWVGGAGSASRLKVAINSWIVAAVEGTAEMLALAEGIGVDPRLALEAISDGPLDLPYMKMKSRAMLERDFEPSFGLALAAKDAGLAVDAARGAGLELPMLEAIHQRMEQAAQVHGDKDLAATYLVSRRPLDG
jgi:3-hydroxyisobutyrate dehydrogenase